MISAALDSEAPGDRPHPRLRERSNRQARNEVSLMGGVPQVTCNLIQARSLSSAAVRSLARALPEPCVR